MMLTNLQAFRFVFALLVFVSHLNYVIPTNNIFWNRMYRYVFREGFIGVTFFFMLSGFILAHRYSKSIEQFTFSFKLFIKRRIARLLPMYYMSLLIALPLTFNEFMHGDRLFYFKKLVTNILLVQSYIPISDYYFSFNGVAWSISTELFFYVCFPFLLFIFISHKNLIRTIVILAITVTGLCIIFFFGKNSYYWLYICPYVRVADFTVGILTYLITKRNHISLFSTTDSKREYLTLSFGLFFLVISPYVHQNFKLSVFYWCPMILFLLVFKDSQGKISKLLQHSIIQYMGSLSFSFYLIHHTIFKYYQNLNELYKFELPTGLLILLLLGLSIFISHLLYTYVEEPARKLLRK